MMPTDTSKLRLPRRDRFFRTINWMAIVAAIIVLSLAAYGFYWSMDRVIDSVAAERADADYVRDVKLAEENRWLRDSNRELLCVLEGKCAMTVPGEVYDHVAEVVWYVARVEGR